MNRRRTSSDMSFAPDRTEGRTSRWSLWATLAVIALFTTWAYHAEIDQITRGQGQIISSSRTQIIQAPDGGVLEALLVREGAEVQRGDVLARLEKTKVESAFREAESKAAALSATVSRLRAEVFGGQPQWEPETLAFTEFRQNQSDLLRKRRDSLRQEIEALERMRALSQKELGMTEPLQATGDVSMADVLRLQRQVADLDGQITNRRNKYLQDVQAELNKAEEELSAAREIMIQRKDQLSNTVLTAPVNGTVKNVRVTTLGGVLRAGDELMQIVPVEDALIVEAKVKPADVAFLKPGLDVTVKIDAYDYTIYGSLPGKLTFISADTMSDETKRDEVFYRIQVKTTSMQFDRRPGENLALQPGMTATAEVKTGQNTVLSYILKPMVKTMSESLGER